MTTPFDFVSILIFAVLAVIFLHRSAQAAPRDRPLWGYALAALACAAGDVAANAGRKLIGTLLLLGAVGLTGWILLASSARDKKRL